MPSFFYKAYRHTYRAVSFGARLGVFVISFLAFLGAVVLGLTQLDTFRAWAIGKGLDALNGELLGRVEVRDVTGNFLTGLHLRDVRLIADSTTMVEAPLVELTYQLRPIFEQRVVGARVIVHRPTVRLIRNERDSVWNFNRVTRPAVDSIETPFNWDIDVQAMELVDGVVIVNDLTAPRGLDTVNRRVDFTNVRLEEFNLALQAHITPTSQSVWLQNVAFAAPQPDLRVVELSGRFTVDTTGLSVDDLYLETTRSQIAMDGRVDSVNFLGVQTAVRSWQDFPITMSLRAPRVSTLELKRLLDAVDFLAGTPSLDLTVIGRFADLRIDRLRLGLPETDLRLTGRLRNLNNPDSLLIDAEIRDSYISYADAMDHMPGLGLPDLRYLGRARVTTASFNGFPLLFTSTIDVTTDIGAVRGGARMDVRTERLGYTGDVVMRNVDLAPLTGDPQMASDFTGRVVASGQGTSLQSIVARVRLESQASVVAGRRYRMVYFDGGIGDGGRIVADTLLVAWGPGGGGEPSTDAQPALPEIARGVSGRSATYVTGELPLTAEARSVFAANPSAGAAGWINLSTAIPEYDLRIAARDVNVADLTLDPANASDLTFSGSVRGRGLDPDDLVGSGRLSIAASTYAGQPVPATNAEYTLETNGAQRTLELTSDIADASVSGTWSFSNLVNSAAKGVNALIDYVARTGAYRGATARIDAPPIDQPINAQYEVTLKDLSRLKPFLGDVEIDASGTINGAIRGSSRSLSISMEGDIERFIFRQGENDLRLASSHVIIDLQNITPGGITTGTGGTIMVRSDSLVRFGDMTFTVPGISVAMANGILRLRGATVVNREISVVVDGEVDASNPSGYLLRFDTLYVDMPSPALSFKNTRPVRAVVSEDAIQIDQLVMQRASREVISVTGTLSGRELRNVEVRLLGASLSDLVALVQQPEEYYGINELGGTLTTAVVNLNGTLDNPEIDAQFAIDSVFYSGTRVGAFTAELIYSDRSAQGRAVIRDVRIRGDTIMAPAVVDIRSLPIDLAFAPREDRLIEGRPIDVSVTADDLPVALLAPFVPGVRLQRGTADIDFGVGGTLPNTVYRGTLSLNNAWALVEGNNVLYRADGQFVFRDNVLEIDRMVIRNDPRELVDSRAQVSGRIMFDGITPEDLDLNIQVDRLLVLSEASEAVDAGVYGDLVIRSGARSLSLSGTIDRPYLSGDVVVLSGDLHIPDTESQLSSGEAVVYMDYENWLALTETTYGPELPPALRDTTQPAPAGSLADVDQSLRAGSLREAGEDLRHFLDSARAREGDEGGSLLDRMTIDVGLELERPITLSMNMSPIEQLRLVIVQEGRNAVFSMAPGEEAQLVGNFALDQGSEYAFIKRFDARGTIRFRGDVGNPEIAINARYDGRQYLESGDAREYTVFVTIQGTPDELRVDFDYDVGGRGSTAPETRFQDALTLLLFGRTSDEIRSQNVDQQLGNLARSVGGSTLSTSMSTALNDAFAGSFVRSFDIEFGDDINQTRLNFVSQFGAVVFRYGGEVANPTDGLVSLEIPLGSIKGLEALRSTVLQLQREVQSSESLTRTGGPATPTETLRLRFQIRIRM